MASSVAACVDRGSLLGLGVRCGTTAFRYWFLLRGRWDRLWWWRWLPLGSLRSSKSDGILYGLVLPNGACSSNKSEPPFVVGAPPIMHKQCLSTALSTSLANLSAIVTTSPVWDSTAWTILSVADFVWAMLHMGASMALEARPDIPTLSSACSNTLNRTVLRKSLKLK